MSNWRKDSGKSGEVLLYKLKLHLHGAEIKELELESGREYSFGRGADCDVQLQDHQAISRTHFRLIEENGQWIAQVVSKFGKINHAGQPVNQLALEVGTVFQLAGYTFRFLERKVQEEPGADFAPVTSALPATIPQEDRYSQSTNLPVAAGAGLTRNLPAVANSDFDGNDEATRVMSTQAEAPYLRIVEGNGQEDTIRLDGRRWVAGREEGCNILLNDRKASRRQFELSSTPQGYFIRDMGSSNGTLLNGQALAPDELRAIRSGDVIQVGKVVLHFEIRDPNFEKKLMVLPAEVRADLPIVVQNPYEMINYPVPSGPGGAVRVGGQGSGGLVAYINNLPIPGTENMAEEKRKKVRFWVVVAVILMPIILILSLSGGEKAPPPKQDPAMQAFLKRTPKEQQQIKEWYQLAMNFYLEKKLSNAAEWLRKIHEILPDGYKNSLAMALECQEQERIAQQLAEIEKEKAMREKIRIEVELTINRCRSVASRTHSLSELNVCLESAISLDPENAMIKDLQRQVEVRAQQKQMDEANQREYRGRVARGKALYDEAVSFENSGDYLDALEAYRKHADSSFPDPNGLKTLSRNQILAIRKKMSSKIDDLVKAAEGAYAIGNFKEAVQRLKESKKIDPRDERVAELFAKYRRELDQKMREIYEEAVISEGLGQVDDAKVKWKKIMETDHHEGEYYNKSRTKLKKYGSM